MTATVAIVGAGIAGLCAARELAARGMRVVVFDRGRQPGGRCGTRDSTAGTFDHGVPGVAAHTPRFRATLAALSARGVVQRWLPRTVAIAHGRASSAAAPEWWVGVPDMRAFVHALAEGLEVTAALRIAKAQPGACAWTLADEAGCDLGEYDALVLAMPLEQARPLVPAASSLRAACVDARSAACWVLMLAFDAALAVPWDYATFVDPVVASAVRENAKPARGASERWVVQATPAWSAAQRTAMASDVAADLAAAFLGALGCPAPPVRSAVAHRWGAARPLPGTAQGVLVDAAHRLVLCGDWSLSADVEGAYLGGLAAAAELHGLLAMPRRDRPRRSALAPTSQSRPDLDRASIVWQRD